MKYIKMLGLAMLAAAALTAIAGASTASATVLCKVTPGAGAVCPKGQDYPAGTAVHADNEANVILHAGFADITCTASTVGGKTSNTGGAAETVKGALETLTFTGCGSATVTVLQKGTLEIHHISGTHDGTVTSNGAEVTVSLFGVHCVYGTVNTDIGRLTSTPGGASESTFDISAKIPRISGSFLCVNNAEWTGNYKVTTPKPLHVGASSA